MAGYPIAPNPVLAQALNQAGLRPPIGQGVLPPQAANAAVGPNAAPPGLDPVAISQRGMSPQDAAAIAALVGATSGQGAPSGQAQSDIQNQINAILQQVTSAIAPAQVNMGALTAPYDQATAAANASGAAGVKAIGADQQQAMSTLDGLTQQYAQLLQQAQGNQAQVNNEAGSNLNGALAPLMSALQAQGAGGANNPLAQEASMLKANQVDQANRAGQLLNNAGLFEKTNLLNQRGIAGEQAQSALGLLQSNLTNALNQIGIQKAAAQLKGTQDQQGYNDAAAKNVATVLSQANKFLQSNAMLNGKQVVEQQLAQASAPGSGHEWAASVFNTLLRGGTDAAGNKIPAASNQAQLEDNFKQAMPALQAKGVDTSMLQDWINNYFGTGPKQYAPNAADLLSQFVSTLAP